jgi:hypothetical protein
MEKLIWSEKITDKQVPESLGEMRRFENNILLSKADWIDHILSRNSLLRDAI